MKIYIGLLVVVALIIAGCINSPESVNAYEKLQDWNNTNLNNTEFNPNFPDDKLNQFGIINYTPIGDVRDCISNLPDGFIKNGWNYNENPEQTVIFYPGELQLNNSKECVSVFSGYKNKTIIGKVLRLGGCRWFTGQINVVPVQATNTVKVTYIVNTGAPGDICTMDIRYEIAWIAIDHLPGYNYSTDTLYRTAID